jgi:hypothetical protein
VTNINDSGSGSLRSAIECATNGDTIRFDAALSGDTITITSDIIGIDKHIIILSTTVPRIKLASLVNGFFDIQSNADVEFREIDIISGLSGSGGATFTNEGSLTLHDVQLFRNPLLPPGEFLVYNHPSSQLEFRGSCFLKTE